MDTRHLEGLFHIYKNPVSYKPEYGTAGFRTNHVNLEGVAFRCGVLMAIRARKVDKNCGVMLTASHNPELDNGVKLVDYDGEMIDNEWEGYATQLAQSTSYDEFNALVIALLGDTIVFNGVVKVLIGQDTRSSGNHLASICAQGVKALGVATIMVGCVTTPELHFYTYQSNACHVSKCKTYTHHLIDAFTTLVGDVGDVGTLHVDCANGVGTLRLVEMKDSLRAMGFELILYNTGDGKLNHMCGADYVEKEHMFPCNMGNIPEYARCCSIDGDADRIVYFTKKDNNMELLNGDKIACLFAQFCSKHCEEHECTPKIGLIQTAYSNGSSTSFVKSNMPNVNIQCTHTGVVHLHKEAKQFDIGVYFEANGHGTVLFNNKKTITTQPLLGVSQLLSQLTGDAIGNMLAIEYILIKHTTFRQWIALYEDLYTRQEKIYTQREAFETTDFARVCVKPYGLQAVIDIAMSKYDNHKVRAFVRPSGTEDIVRLYIEGNTKSSLEKVAMQISEAIKHLVQ
jgi:phosphoacetylglucosamine mutase